MTVPRLDDSPLIPVSDEQRRRAALVVCGRAPDRESARELLDALGLLTDPAVTQPRELSGPSAQVAARPS